MEEEKDFGQLHVSSMLKNLAGRGDELLSDMETFLTLPIDYLKANMDEDAFMAYVAMREKTIHLLELLEVFVYDTHDESMRCFECGERFPEIVEARVKGNPNVGERINGAIEHWLFNGKIGHIFICDECLRKIQKKGLMQ